MGYEAYDDFPTCARTFATVRIYHDVLRPERISQELGIEPTGSMRAGMRGHMRSPVTAKTNAWFLGSGGSVDSLDARRHIDWLLDLLEPRSDALNRLRAEGCTVIMTVFWESAHGHDGPILSPVNMRRLAELGIEVRFDVYFTDRGAGSAEQRFEPPSH